MEGDILHGIGLQMKKKRGLKTDIIESTTNNMRCCMKQPSLDNIQNLLAQPTLQKLASQTVKLQALQNLLEVNLDAALKPHCKVATFDAGVLTLVIDSSAFAARLRYLQHTLLELLKKYKEFNGIYKINWLISPLTSPPAHPVYQRTLSKENAYLLTETANTCSNQEIKAVLLRLAEHGIKQH